MVIANLFNLNMIALADGMAHWLSRWRLFS